MSRVIDMSAARKIEPRYVLVADTHLPRVAACLESLKPFNIGVLVARDGDEAIRVVKRFGPPVLLIIDLSLSGKDGFAVIEAFREVDRAGAQVIAWSASKELREFATQRLAGLNVRILGGTVPRGIVRGAIERALRREALATSGSNSGPTAEDVHQTMTELSEQARHLCATPGVAVYLKASGETQFRASVTWTSDEPTPDLPYHLPRVFSSIVETGKPLVLPDLAMEPISEQPASTLHDVIGGLVAVPIVSTNQQVIGTICVFDFKPLTLSSAQIEALEALGRGVSIGSAATRIHPAAGNQSVRDMAPATTHPAAAESSVTEPAPSSFDSPTALFDRIGGTFAVRRELARARREQAQLSIVLFDVIEVVGGAGGTTAGPTAEVFGEVGEILMKAIRGSDLAIRWSGAQLLLVLTGVNITEARPVAERVRAVMQAGANDRMAVTCGVAEFLANEPFESVLTRASDKVRLARERGPNRVA